MIKIMKIRIVNLLLLIGLVIVSILAGYYQTAYEIEKEKFNILYQTAKYKLSKEELNQIMNIQTQ